MVLSGHRTETAKNGFTLIEILFVVAIIGVMLAIAIPSFTNARDKARRNCCIKNLSQIQTAKEQFIIVSKRVEGDDVNMDELVPAYIRRIPECPADGVYDPMPMGQNPICTIDGHDL